MFVAFLVLQKRIRLVGLERRQHVEGHENCSGIDAQKALKQ
jgi:hypothetical protein